MRILFSLIALLIGAALPAQNFSQNAAPVQQTIASDDCYTRNLDNGNAALRRGETKTALHFFYEAKKCPDVQGNTRRISELDAQISRCEQQLDVVKTQTEAVIPVAVKNTRKNSGAELPSTRRNYKANQQFLKDTLENCFSRMEEEADRAFNMHFWEDAASLYRAAKNCADADQNDRHRMSEKILTCRNAAENELFAKQQEAERQARHAIAANLADDAQELLHNTDRTLAFRLADFANQYVAPDDNLDCVQAMFDAWYYRPAEDAQFHNEELYNPVFCYEIADNLGENIQLHFQPSKEGEQLLWAFVPGNGDMFAWEMPGMKQVQSFSTGEGNGYNGFDFSPDGELLFWGNRFFELRRGSRTRRIDVPAVGPWCFNLRGDEFFYENIAEKNIYIFDVKAGLPLHISRKGSKNSATISVPTEPRLIISDVPDELLAMQYLDGKFWLGFRDRIEVLSKPATGKPWVNERTIRFQDVVIPDYVDSKELSLSMHAEKGFAVLAWRQAFWSIPLNQQPDSNAVQKPFMLESARVMAISPETGKVAFENTGFVNGNGFWVVNALKGDTLLRQRVPAFSDFELFRGSFSQNEKWVAASTYYGNIKIWSMQEASSIWTTALPRPPDERPMFSPDGGRLFTIMADTLCVFHTSGSGNKDFVEKCAGAVLRGASDHWVLMQVSPDSVEAQNLIDGRSRRFPMSNQDYRLLYAFDDKNDKTVAISTPANRLEVRSLQNGNLVAAHQFDGGLLGELYYVPKLDELLVVQHQAMGEAEIAQSTVKLWAPGIPNSRPQVLRLHDYSVRTLALDYSGTQVAFSNGSDIRIFDLQNIENEALKIRGLLEAVQALAFRPNTKLLAAAYTNGKVVFWNTETGQKALQLQVANGLALSQGLLEITAIGFSHNGTVLQVVLSDGKVLSYALDPSYIRSLAQDENRQLQSFDVEQIVNYNLESALYYPGNFERLAASGDAPLVRSFFMHFREQAVESNNISQVRDYCEKALYLYEKLDENTQKTWKSNMAYMYEDYARKLILRGNLKDATQVIQFMKRKFEQDPVLLNAHIALMQRDYKSASALYTRYLLTMEGGLPSPSPSHLNFDYVENEVRQLKDFEFIDSLQLDCFCGTVQLSGGFTNLCPLEHHYNDTYLSTQDRMRWSINENLWKAGNTFRMGAKNRLLKEAYDIARQFVRQYPTDGQAWLETAVLQLAENYRNLGTFEQNSPTALQHYKEGVEVLEAVGSFRKLADTSRLSILSSIELFWGKKLLDSGKSADAINMLSSGLDHARTLSEAVYQADSTLLTPYYNTLVAPLLVHLGTALLLEGKPAEARQAYDRANSAMTNGLNSLYQANVAVFEHDDTQAFLDYGNIFDPSQTAIAVFELERLAEKFPEHKAYIQEFIPRMLSGLQSKNPRLANEEMGYWLARMKIDYFASQLKYDSSVVWSKIALAKAKRALDLSKGDETWVVRWLDEHVDVSYYLLLSGWNRPESLKECIDYEAKADDYLSQEEHSSLYYSNRESLKSNLAHALVLRNQPGDRDKALALYKHYIESNVDPRGYDNTDLLEKDIRDLKALGAPWPDLPGLSEMLTPQN